MTPPPPGGGMDTGGGGGTQAPSTGTVCHLFLWEHTTLNCGVALYANSAQFRLRQYFQRSMSLVNPFTTKR